RHVDHLVLRAEWVLKATQLRGAHMEWHLPALKTGLHLVAGLRTLGTATCRLTLRRCTTSDTSLRGLAAGCGAKVVCLQHLSALFILLAHASISSTFTR